MTTIDLDPHQLLEQAAHESLMNFHTSVAEVLRIAAITEITRVISESGVDLGGAQVDIVVKVGDCSAGSGWNVKPATTPVVAPASTLPDGVKRAMGSSLVKPKTPRAEPATKRGRELKAARGRPQGELGKAVVAYLETEQESREPASIHRELVRQGLECSQDNLHQTLRRLAARGEIKRVRRGMYAKTSALA